MIGKPSSPVRREAARKRTSLRLTPRCAAHPSAWYYGMKRLRIRWERRDDIHEAFLGLATCIICYRHVRRFC